jgi:HEAT repeat protein
MQKLFTILAIFVVLVFSTGTASAANKGKKSAAAASARGKKAGATSKKATAPGKPTKGSKNKRRPAGKAAKKKTKKQLREEAAQTAALAETEFKDALEKLGSGVPNEVLEAVQVLGMSDRKEAARPIMKLLQKGPRSDITDAAIFALGSIGEAGSAPLLMTYLNHRRPDARIAALFALEKYRGKNVTAAIEGALRDSDRQVRASASLALGKRGDVTSVPILFRAFEHGVSDAVISIGQLGSPDDAKRMLSYLGKEDIKVLLAGFEEFLNRDDFPESAKLNILNRLFDLAGPEVWRFAVTLKASFPPDTSEEENKVYKLVCRMVRQIKDKQ